MFKQESSLIFWDNQINGVSWLIDYQLGTPANVEFNFNILWKFIKTSNSLNDYPLIDIRDVNLLHVHPPGHLYYSELDRQVMKGFSLAFGNASPFYIICFDNDDIRDLKCTSKLYRYNKIKKEIEDVYPDGKHVAEQYIEDQYLAILKLLAYGDFLEKQEENILSNEEKSNIIDIRR